MNATTLTTPQTLDAHSEGTLRADFDRYYVYDREAVRRIRACRADWSEPNEIAWGIDASYRALPATDPRRIEWQHLIDLATQWDQIPDDMYERLDDFEQHHAAGRPMISDIDLRHRQQTRRLYMAATTAGNGR